MSAASRLVRRLATPEAQQYLALYFIALLFALVATWPTLENGANDAWFSLAYTRAAALGLLGLGYGVMRAAARRDELVEVAMMLACFALLAMPLEISTYAAAYPATPLPWVLALPPLTALAMFAIGLLLGRLLELVRLRLLAPIVVPAALVGMVAFDVTTGVNVLNPFTAAVQVSLPHLAALVIAVLGLFAALWRWGRGAGREPAAGRGSR